MFRRACERAAAYTVPVVLSQRYLDNRVECAVGTAIVLNSDGWILTAAHVLETLANSAAPDAGTNAGHSEGSVAEHVVQNFSYWFGADEWTVPAWHLFPSADIAVGRIDGFSAGQVSAYPTFQEGGLAVGASLCRLGFPFASVDATYDETTDRFTLAPGSLPIPRFPNEGILTRFILGTASDDPPIGVRFIETSSPGLRGQSGGPIFDTDANIWGIQAMTAHLPLGFDPEVDVSGTLRTEYQFMNVGRGTSSETALAFLRHLGVAVATHASYT